MSRPTEMAHETNKARLVKIRAYKKLLISGSLENWQLFVDAKNCYIRFVSGSKNAFKNASQNFGEATFPPLIFDNDIISTSDGKANLFVK